MDRISRKFETALQYIPEPEFSFNIPGNSVGLKLGLLYFGTTSSAIQEALDSLGRQDLQFDTARIKAFPFHQSVNDFVDQHDFIFVIEQNRDAQMKSLLKIECGAENDKLKSILSYNGVLITAQHIEKEILNFLESHDQSGVDTLSTQAT